MSVSSKVFTQGQLEVLESNLGLGLFLPLCLFEGQVVVDDPLEHVVDPLDSEDSDVALQLDEAGRDIDEVLLGLDTGLLDLAHGLQQSTLDALLQSQDHIGILLLPLVLLQLHLDLLVLLIPLLLYHPQLLTHLLVVLL